MNLAQRIGQEFKTLRDTELNPEITRAIAAETQLQTNLDAEESRAVAAESALQTTMSSMFIKSGDDITFKGNLIPDSNEMWSIGSETSKIKDLFVSANTIYLGENTTVEGTGIVIDAGDSPTSVSDTPTVVASSIIAKPFTYNPGTGNVTVRPMIAFQDTLGNNYPISFDTANAKFSFDALGNHGQGSIVVKNIELDDAGTLTNSALLIDNAQIRHDGNLRIDGNANLGYDASSVHTIRGTVNFENDVTFGGTALDLQKAYDSTDPDANGAASITLQTGKDFRIYDDSNNTIFFAVDSETGEVKMTGAVTMSGTSTGVTAAAGTNTTQLATTAFVQTAVANLIDSSPAALDTLNELAAALGDDPNFASTISDQIGTKLDATANAVSASKLATARTISLNGDVTGSASFDGSANISITATIADDSHNHIISNVDGLQTALDAKQNASTAINTENIGSQSVNYASSAGTAATCSGNASTATWADTVDVNTSTSNAWYNVNWHSGDTLYGANGKLQLNPYSGDVQAAGDITAYYSDERLKNFEGKIEGALDKILALNGYYYKGNEVAGSLGYDTELRQVGVSAQEVEAVLPEVIKAAPINESAGTDYKTVQYDKLTALLIEAVKEQQVLIDELRAEINNLK